MHYLEAEPCTDWAWLLLSVPSRLWSIVHSALGWVPQGTKDM